MTYFTGLPDYRLARTTAQAQTSATAACARLNANEGPSRRQSKDSPERKDGKMNRKFLLDANSIRRDTTNPMPIGQNKGRIHGMRTIIKAVISRGSLIGAALALTACLATPLWAAPFFFSTGNPNGALGALSRRPSAGSSETETADDFFLQETTVITQATIFGLIPTGTPVENIRDVEVEVYHVFPRDSDVGRTSGPPMFSTAQVPTRNNSPSDVEIDTATRARTAGTLTTSARVLGASFTVGSTVVNSINVNAGSEGSAVGEEVEITITFTSPIVLPPGHYFFRPEVLLTSGDFLYLSGPRPLVPPPFSPDLQAWIRNSNLAPDWLRIGTD